ncbi:iron reductase domain protein [Aulographum hederae CBS 113979]|uniref:Iron reductase domain protein n=1 Tax=Aulographum hederae CBS 113979 TaxID=1176131 RepID=A0A6G1GL79_9PEZI|nr:iron reductase domain protein [Aulographum hederae CBS 113979]
MRSFLLSLLLPLAAAQTQSYITDASTGIKLFTTTVGADETDGGFSFGYALSPDAGKDEYIGYLSGSRGAEGGWTGISHGGSMINSLLLMAWADEAAETVRTSFRFATGYTPPATYTGNATLTPISHGLNTTHFTLLYHCLNCWSWTQTINATTPAKSGSALPDLTGSTSQVLGWAQSSKSPAPVDDAKGTIGFHDNGQGNFGVDPKSAVNAEYSVWAALAKSPGFGAAATAGGNATAAEGEGEAEASVSAVLDPTATPVVPVVAAGAEEGWNGTTSAIRPANDAFPAETVTAFFPGHAAAAAASPAPSSAVAVEGGSNLHASAGAVGGAKGIASNNQNDANQNNNANGPIVVPEGAETVTLTDTPFVLESATWPGQLKSALPRPTKVVEKPFGKRIVRRKRGADMDVEGGVDV